MVAGSSKSIRNFVLLAAGLFCFLTWFLGDRGLNDPDEGRNTNIARNFLKPGADLWEPRMSGFGHYDKPPLIYWTTALSLRIFGQNETAARLPSVFGAVLTLAGIGWAATRLYSKQVAWWTILICGTFGQFWLLARFLTLDMLLTGWTTLGIAAWIECRHRNGDWRFWILSMFCWVLGWWTKAIAVLVPLLGITGAVLILRDNRGKGSLRPFYLLLGVLVLGSVWYVRMIQQHGELVDFFFVREMKGRITGHVEGRKGPIYYYLLLSFAAWLPWWPLALRAFVYKWKQSRLTLRQVAAVLGLEGWTAIIGITVFSCISSKLPGYTLPFAPWVALLFARAIVKLQAEIPSRNFRRWVFISAGSFCGLLLIAAPMVKGYESRLGQNSSLREVSAVLKARGATAVYLDRYWPSMEFYFGSKTFYVLRDDYLFKAKIHQRSDDSGIDPAIGEPHFYFPKTWQTSLKKNSTENIWLVHYHKESPSPFDQFLSIGNRTEENLKIGNFVLVRVPPQAIP